MDRVSDSGPSAASAPFPSYPGERLGLPEDGPGSVAGWGRRFVALAIDWVASILVAAFLFGYEWYGATSTEQGWIGTTPLLVFWFEASVLTALLGGSFGQLIMRIAVVRLDSRPLNLLQAMLRTALICLVVPPLVFNRDQRGLHDLAVKSVTLRR